VSAAAEAEGREEKSRRHLPKTKLRDLRELS
jgi:hypothetical protein